MEKNKISISSNKFTYSVIDFTLLFAFILLLIRMIDY